MGSNPYLSFYGYDASAGAAIRADTYRASTAGMPQWQASGALLPPRPAGPSWLDDPNRDTQHAYASGPSATRHAGLSLSKADPYRKLADIPQWALPSELQISSASVSPTSSHLPRSSQASPIHRARPPPEEPRPSQLPLSDALQVSTSQAALQVHTQPIQAQASLPHAWGPVQHPRPGSTRPLPSHQSAPQTGEILPDALYTMHLQAA